MPKTTTAHWALVMVEDHKVKLETGCPPRSHLLLERGPFLAELYAIYYGIRYCKEPGSTVNLYSDCLAAIQYIQRSCRPTRLQLLTDIDKIIVDRNLTVTYHFIPEQTDVYQAYAHHACHMRRTDRRPYDFDSFKKCRLRSLLGQIEKEAS
jgi:hypothetical protein